MNPRSSVAPFVAVSAGAAAAAFLLAALLAVGAEGEARAGASAGDVSTLLTTHCTKCHGDRRKSAGLDLTAGAAALVGRASSQNPSLDLIKPGDPDASYLFLKVTDRHGGGGQGARMPLGAGALPDSAIDTLRAWIVAGAP